MNSFWGGVVTSLCTVACLVALGVFLFPMFMLLTGGEPIHHFRYWRESRARRKGEKKRD